MVKKKESESCDVKERLERLEHEMMLRHGRNVLIILLVLYFGMGCAFGWILSLLWGVFF